MSQTVYLLAQAESPSSPADAVQQGTVVVTETPPGEVAGGEQHATTEAGHSDVFPPFDTTTFASQIVWFALCFAVLYVVMSRVALPQIGSIIDKRKARIEGDLKEAERLRGETDKAVAAYEQALADARANAHGIAEETRNSIKADLDGKRKAVEEDLARKVADAEARIARSKDAALTNVNEIATDTATALVTRLIGEASKAEVEAAVAQVVKG